MTVDHDQLKAWLDRERELAARGGKRRRKRPAQAPVTRAAKLLPVDWRVLERLAGYGPRGIWPGVPELAAKLGVSDRTVQRSLRRLEAAGRVVAVPVFEHPDDENWTARGRPIRHLGARATNTYRVTGPGDTTIDRISRETAAQTPVTRPESDNSRVTPGTRVSGSSGECRYQGPTRSEVLASLERAFGPVQVVAEWPNNRRR